MDVFNRFKSVIKIREVLIHDEVFQLHYRVTALLLLGCGALVASKQHFGDPIDCITRDDVPGKIMDTYCWIHSTFTLPSACNKTVGVEVAHPCVDKFSSDREERVYHKYYQWVYFVLFFQAICFYAPHFAWKMYESKLIQKLLTTNFRNPFCKGKAVEDIVRYIIRNNGQQHEQYFRIYILCEICNFVNVIMQIYLVDLFLGGTFTTYGLEVLEYVQLDQENRVDPMVRVFPRMTKCTFHRFGASGDVQKYDALCILPLNIINEKIYITMWFWFVFLAAVTGIWLIYRFLTLTQPKLRLMVLKRRANLVKPKVVSDVLNELTAGDWFLLSILCSNMHSQSFKSLMHRLHGWAQARRSEKRNGEKSAKHPTLSYNIEIDESVSDVESDEELEISDDQAVALTVVDAKK